MGKRLLSMICVVALIMMAWGILSLTDVFGETAKAAAKINGTIFNAPLDNFNPNVYSSGFGPRSVNGGSSWHAAIDYGRDYGASIYPIYEGTVINKGYDPGKTDTYGSGHFITIKHDIGNRTIYSHYQHMNSSSPFGIGSFVTPDNVIGYVGHSGDENYNGSKMGSHLDIRIMEGGSRAWDLLSSSQVVSTKGSYESAVSTSGITYYNPAKVLDGTIQFNIAPIVNLDIVEATEGKLWIRGWAFDPDATSKALSIHVYVRDSGGTLSWLGSTTANTLRQDVDDVYKCGNLHGFDEVFYTKDLEGIYAVHVAAIDTNGGPATWRIQEGVSFKNDSVTPLITDICIDDITANRFQVRVTATDNVAVSNVKVPTWRASLGGSMATWYDAERVDQTTWRFSVPCGTEEPTHYADIYVYDYQGNSVREGYFRHSNIITAFDANGGGCDVNSKEIAAVWHNDTPFQTYGALPVPERKGYRFIGWFTGLEGGYEVQSDTYVTSKYDHTLYAHWECERIMQTPDFTLPASLTIIEESAFEGLSMTVVQCPEGVEEIQAYAFRDCANLEEIYIPDSVVFIDGGAFDGCAEGLTIFGHAGSLAETFAELNQIDFIDVD